MIVQCPTCGSWSQTRREFVGCLGDILQCEDLWHGPNLSAAEEVRQLMAEAGATEDEHEVCVPVRVLKALLANQT